MSEEIMALVDEKNQIIGEVLRSKMRFGVDFHRATYILVFTTSGQLIVQKRTLNKSFCPGWYGITTGGVVASGESYQLCAQRELVEELGVAADLTCHGLFYTEGEGFKIWGKIYSFTYDESQHGPLVPQPSEVASLHYMNIKDIFDNTPQHLFTKDSLDALVHYVNNLTQDNSTDPL
ncbi:NUDIX hydrolase [Marinomonas sp. 2405UD68-3]|uniref:NUDIX hydrolase n=1 Tax=Marinomonas sp. 2405UD68-3 TaxID=3391835 RepID=UPI0039C904D8